MRPQNLTGSLGAHASDLLLQGFGLAAFLFPVLALVMGWKWMRSEEIEAPLIKLIGCVMLFLSACAAAALAPEFRIFEGAIPLGGAAGVVLADLLHGQLNWTGSIIVTATALIVSIYLVSTFTLSVLSGWLSVPLAMWKRWMEKQRALATERRLRRREKIKEQITASGHRQDSRKSSRRQRRAAKPPLSRSRF